MLNFDLKHTQTQTAHTHRQYTHIYRVYRLSSKARAEIVTLYMEHDQSVVFFFVCCLSHSTFKWRHTKWSTLYRVSTQTKTGRLSTSSATLALICLLATVHLLLLRLLPLPLPLLLAYYFCCFSRKFMHIISLLENLKICCEFMSERHPMPINRAQKL